MYHVWSSILKQLAWKSNIALIGKPALGLLNQHLIPTTNLKLVLQKQFRVLSSVYQFAFRIVWKHWILANTATDNFNSQTIFWIPDIHHIIAKRCICYLLKKIKSNVACYILYDTSYDIGEICQEVLFRNI